MGQANPQLSDALKRLSAAKYGRSRAEVEQEIFKRLSVKKAAPVSRPGMPSPGASSLTKPGSTGGSSFLDEWLAKRKQMTGAPVAPGSAPKAMGQPITAPRPRPVAPAFPGAAAPTAPTGAPEGMQASPFVSAPTGPGPVAPAPIVSPAPAPPQEVPIVAPPTLVSPPAPEDKLQLRGGVDDHDSEVSVKLH